MGKKDSQPERTPRWDGIVRRSLDFECRAINAEERSFEVVASTDTLDAHGDIVEQTFDLKRYKKNPVVLWLHNNFGFLDGSTAEDFLPIGRAENVKLEDGQLVAKIVFVAGDAEQEPLVDKIWRRIEQRVLRAVSIGFRPGKVTREENADTGKVTYRLAKNELFEISVVPIPSNPDAVAKAALELERQGLEDLVKQQDPGRTAAQKTAERGKDKSTMDEELKKALEAKALAEKALADEQARAKKLEADLAAEKTLSTKLQTELDAATKRADEAEAKVVDAEIGKYVGKKIFPAEKDEMVDLAKSVGIDRVKSLIEKRPDITLTTPVEIDGKGLGALTSPPPVEGGANGASADLVKTATERARA